MSDALQMLEVLGNDLFEIRALQVDGPAISGFFDDKSQGAAEATRLSNEGWQGRPLKGVYTTFNELSSDSIPPTNEVRAAVSCTKAKDVVRRRFLVLDIDPQKPTKFKDDPASESEHEAVFGLKDAAIRLTTELGWPDPFVVDSGNGAYLIYAVDLPNDEPTKTLIKSVLEGFADKLDNDQGHIDRSICDAPRVIRLAGTINRKGQESGDRRFREARILSTPGKLVPVSEQQLRDFVGEAPTPEQQLAVKVPSAPNPELQQMMLRAVTEYLIPTEFKGFTVDQSTDPIKVQLPHCTRGPEHKTDGAPAILIFPDGAIGYKCFHGKCSSVTWTSFQDHIGTRFDDFLAEFANKIVTGQDQYVFNDPLLLARRFIESRETDDGTPTFTFFGGQLYQYDGFGWREESPGKLTPFIRPDVQNVFDMRAHCTGKRPKPVTRSLLNETYDAVSSEARRDVSPNQLPPFWLDGNSTSPWDLLVLRNGFLNLRDFVEGEGEVLTPRSPKLFYSWYSDFDFDPSATAHPEWDRFLQSLGQDDDWYDCLRQIMGYCLWRGYDLQKYFVFVGPTRSGKGTIAKVMQNLVGGDVAVCGPELQDFATEFGLEPVVGKQLAFIPEIHMPSKGGAQIVSRLKAFTGGDLVAINRKNKPVIATRDLPKIIMQTNDFVPLPDSSGALHARALPLKFTKSFLGIEDTELEEKLVPEYSAILNWSLQGLREVYTEGFKIPQSSRYELEQLKAESSPLSEFVEECCIVDTQKAVRSPSLYKIYERWMAENYPGENCPTSEAFASELRATVGQVIKVPKSTTKSATFHDGHQIVPTAHDDLKKRQPLWLKICPNQDWAGLAV